MPREHPSVRGYKQPEERTSPVVRPQELSKLTELPRLGQFSGCVGHEGIQPGLLPKAKRTGSTFDGIATRKRSEEIYPTERLKYSKE